MTSVLPKSPDLVVAVVAAAVCLRVRCEGGKYMLSLHWKLFLKSVGKEKSIWVEAAQGAVCYVGGNYVIWIRH